MGKKKIREKKGGKVEMEIYILKEQDIYDNRLLGPVPNLGGPLWESYF